jgi:NAD(P)-dependent dehydrogenase (short-subunit alcohol dehydrogenase family)
MGVPVLSLEGRVTIVTGSRRGIGRAIALLFAEAGSDVAVCDFVAGRELDAAAEEITKLGRCSLAMQADVTDINSVNNCVQKAEGELGDIDILVNAAGILNVSSLVDLPEAEWDRILDTNLKGTYLTCQAVAKGMIKRKEGCIINIASTDAFNASPYRTAYNCSKAGVRMLTTILAFELGRYNIRVNAIAPGWVRTKMTEYLETESLMQAAMASVALGRIAEPREIANVALFLASDLAAYVSGATWRVDGAFSQPSLSEWPKSAQID